MIVTITAFFIKFQSIWKTSGEKFQCYHEWSKNIRIDLFKKYNLRSIKSCAVQIEKNILAILKKTWRIIEVDQIWEI